MRHAGVDALDRLGELIGQLRVRSALREKRPGIFYLKGRAFLHFHEDRDGLFADLRQGGDWQRLPVNDRESCTRLLEGVDRALAQVAATPLKNDGQVEIERLFGTRR
jgi:hypothetical protein